MRARRGRWWTALGLFLGLMVPGTASAGPYIGEWGWCWHPAGDCPKKGEYSWLHYWARDLYVIRACVHPVHLDSYPPGVPVPLTAAYYPFHCQTYPPVPSPPYSDPAAYYGRPLVPPPEETKETK